MATRTFDLETYKKLGMPDIGRRMFYVHGITGKKVYGNVTMLKYVKKGVELTIKKDKQ